MTREAIRVPPSVFVRAFMSKRSSLMCRLSFSTQRVGGGPWTLRRCQERPQADQVVRRGREGHDPVDEFTPAVPQLPQAADGLHPAKHLFDQFALALADGIARVPRGPAVDAHCGSSGPHAG